MKAAVLDHITYEFQMYLYTFERINFGGLDVEQFDRNCYWTVHCVSLRNIVKFFLKPSKEILDKNDNLKDNLYYDNFKYGSNQYAYINYSINKDLKDELEKINAELKKINKGVCHLTEKRFDWIDEPLDNPVKRLIDKAIDTVLKLAKLFLNFLDIEKEHNIEYETYKKKNRNISEELNNPIIVDYINYLKDYIEVVERLWMMKNTSK